MNSTVKIWLEIALSDLKSASLLYDNEHYRTSYFFFQQASEKANKALALLNGKLSKKEFDDIKHDQLKIYKKTIVKQENEIKKFIEIINPLPKVLNHEILSKSNITEYSQSLKDSTSFIDSLKNYDLVNIAISDLVYLLAQLKEIKETKINVPNDYEKIFETKMLGITDWIGNLKTHEAINVKEDLLNFIVNKEQTKQFYDIIKKQIFPMMIDLVFINLTFYVCAIITIQHSSLTRYAENDINPDNIYIKQLPIIVKQDAFMDMLYEAICKLDRINS